MARLNNPFVVYGYKGAEYFCDRQKETEKMISSLHNERNITLVAPRRMGKTGLIHHVFHQMEEQYEGVKCFYLDIFATKNLEQMVQLMASEIIGKLDTVSQSALRKVQEFFSSWRPTLTIDELTGIPTFSLDLKPSEGRESLKRIFEYLKQSGKRCYIAIDEFQQILSYPEDGVEAMIRSYIQFLPNVYFVFSGSQQHMMQEMFLLKNKFPCLRRARWLSIFLREFRKCCTHQTGLISLRVQARRSLCITRPSSSCCLSQLSMPTLFIACVTWWMSVSTSCRCRLMCGLNMNVKRSNTFVRAI